MTLHAPVPVETPLLLRKAGRRTHLWAGEELIASASSEKGQIGRVDPVDIAVARTSRERFGGQVGHPFPTCFVCGMDRADGDGLLLTPAPVPGLIRTTACVWRPSPAVTDTRGHVPDEIVWSVLDCPGGWTADPVAEPMVLARMSAELYTRPVVGAEYLVVARQNSRSGRTSSNTSTLYDHVGTVLGTATAVWVAVNP